ncbi:MAG: hypothetical protein DIU63_07405 [Proteobacteria bacterium]|nr:MAG: hypothetical protein DIU63_07405 [Pseudomonadota bacterium]
MPTHSVRSASLAHLLSPVSIIPLLAAGMSAPAKAQTTLELPGIVVEGATLEAPRSAPKRKSAATTSPASNGVSQQEGPAEVAEEGAAKSEAASNQAGGIPAAHLGTAVTVVTGEDLQRQQIRHAADALRSLPGVSVNRSGSPAHLTAVRIRGAEHNHTLVLIDGIEANTGSNGAFDFSDLMTEDIERIEVIRGPQSALYGSNAIGGVINVITKRGGGPLAITARAEGGSFGTKGGAARVSGGNERIWGSATVQHQRSDGFNIAPEGEWGEKDGYRVTSLSANAGVMLAENIRLDLNIRHSDKHVRNDDQTGISVRNEWVIANDSLNFTNSSVLLMGANLRWDMLEGRLTHVFSASRNETRWNDYWFGAGFGPPSITNTNDDAYRLSYKTSYHFAMPVIGLQNSVSGLIEHGKESFENKTEWGFVEASRKLTSFAGEWRGDVLGRVYLTAGIRHDDYDAFKDFTSWRAGISVPIPEMGIRPHASAGTGMKAPTLIEQFGYFDRYLPNPALVPETSESWDAGVEFTLLNGKATVDITYFSMNITNKIGSETVACPDPNQFFCTIPINLDGVSRRKGLEVDTRVQIFPNLSVGLAYTYLDAVESTGMREARRPPHAARGDITYKFDEGRGTFHLAAIYNGEMQDNVFNFDWTKSGRVTLDDYWLVTAAASYKLNPGLEIYGRIENLFDEDYEEIFGFSTAGIAGYAGLRWTFDAEQLGNGLSMK